MSSVNTMEAFERLMPMVNLIGGVNIILGLLPLIISIVTLVLVIKLYKRK